MKNIFIALFLIIVLCVPSYSATLTVGNVPRVNTGGITPKLEDSNIVDNGNVGIGTSLPVTKFQVTGGNITTEGVNINGSGTIGKLSASGGIGIDPNHLAYTTPQVLIDSSGNVGIGTTIITDKLTVNGSIKALGTITAGGFDEALVASHSKIDLGTGLPGVISLMSINNSNNGHLDIDCESTPSKCAFSSSATTYQYPNNLQVNRIIAGGASLGVATNVSDRIVSYYKMEDSAANTIVTDEQALNAGTLSGTTAATITTQGKLGNGFILDGVDDYINLGSGASLKVTSGLTFETWIKTTQSATGRIAGNRSASGAKVGWEAILISGQFRLMLSNGSSVITSQSSTVINNGSWHFIVGSWDGTTIKVYVDGALEDLDALSGDIGTGASNTYVGRTPVSANYTAATYDNLKIYNGEVVQSEITFLYNGGVGTESLSGGGTSINTQVIGTSTSVASNHGLNTLKDIVVEGVGEFQGGAAVDQTIMHKDSSNGTFTECGTQDGVGWCTVDANGVIDGS